MSTEHEAVGDDPAGQVRWLTVVAVVLLVIALGFAGWFGVAWANAATSDSARYSGARDDVLRVGEQMAINFTSPDYQHLDQFQQRLESSTTGALHDQIEQTISQYRSQFDQNKLVATSELVDGAVTSLDLHGNKATVLVVVQATKKNTDPKAQQQPSQRLPIVIGLARTADGAPWLADSVSGAPTAGQ